jgi:hypothetical protein
MTCRDCRDLLLEVARRRAAPFVDRDVRAHAASCPECAACLERQTALSAGLRAVAAAAEQSDVSPEIQARLMAAFAVERVRPVARPSLPAARWLPVAAAAVLCVAAAAWWLARPRPVDPPAAQVARVAPSPPLAVAHPAAGVDPTTVARSEGVSAPAARRGRPAARRVAPAPVQAVGFVPIPSAAGLPDFESGEIVRMGIEITALPNYGLEIPSGAQSAIQADLLIGQDGQARAIRLVSAVPDAPRARQ